MQIIVQSFQQLHSYNMQFSLLVIACALCISVTYAQDDDYTSSSYQRPRGHYKYGDNYRNAPRHGYGQDSDYDEIRDDDYYGDDQHYGYYNYGCKQYIAINIATTVPHKVQLFG